MYELNPERNRENMPPFNHKTALRFKFEKNKRQTNKYNQPTVGTNVTRDTQHTANVYNVIHCAQFLNKCSLLKMSILNMILTALDHDPSSYLTVSTSF